jgi:hypothetical protein
MKHVTFISKPALADEKGPVLEGGCDGKLFGCLARALVRLLSRPGGTLTP